MGRVPKLKKNGKVSTFLWIRGGSLKANYQGGGGHREEACGNYV